ncbi:hypothetical protein DNTS_030391 [Danionella cerebrum]|uniref:C-type natriuretic peptide 1 n=1 Tax=Danionella cerebrum TaxID=2873325 RepID=A0A553QWF9_9TELE|nr:hypothetical protein DNTS_030391 [Danionella translucida]
MLCSSVFALILVLLASPEPARTRAVHSPDKALQVIEQILDRYNDLLDGVENLTSDQLEEPAQSLSPGLKGSEYPKWIDEPAQSENAWLRLLKGTLTNQKRAPPDRLRRGWNRGCFGLKLDRIGSMSGLGC